MGKKLLSGLPLFVFFLLVAVIGYFAIQNETPLPKTPTPTETPTENFIATEPSAPPPPPPSLIVSTDIPTPTGPPTPSPTSTFTTTPTNTLTPPSPTPTDTPTSALTPTFTPVPPQAVVVANELNLRSGPGTTYDSIGVLNQGDTLDIQSRLANNVWIQVAPARFDDLGWVNAAPKFVQINVDLNTIPIVVPPTPPPIPMPSVVLASTFYPTPALTNPDNGVGTLGAFPPLFWQWPGELKEDEFFEVRVWHEDLPYHAALGWVKQTQFDYNISGERNGKYFWSVIVVKGKNPKPKDWIKPGWPYPVWDGELVKELSPESEIRDFFFTVDGGGGGGPISKPPPRN